jgi:hypothetical protein
MAAIKINVDKKRTKIDEDYKEIKTCIKKN